MHSGPSTKRRVGLPAGPSGKRLQGQWQAPLSVAVAQLFKVGTQMLQAQVAHSIGRMRPTTDLQGWAWRLQLTLLFPK